MNRGGGFRTGLAPPALPGYVAAEPQYHIRWVMIVATAVLVGLVPATAAALGYLVPTLAGPFGPRAPRRAPTHVFTILVPPHDEESTLPITLGSLAVLDYPPELMRVYVVADNCTDGTAAVARAVGADCAVRSDPEKRGKGFALAFGLDRV